MGFLSITSLFLLFITGLCVGTFLTTCIERLAFTEDDFYGEEENIDKWYYKIPLFSVFIALPLFTRFRVLFPPSKCINCQKLLPLSERIPVLSYFRLKFRCSKCKYPIPGRYWLIELFTGLLFFYSGYHFGFSLHLFLSLILISLFMIATVVDFKYQIIPDEVSLTGLVLGFALATTNSIFMFSTFVIEQINQPTTNQLNSLTNLNSNLSSIFKPAFTDTFLLRPYSLGWAITGFMAGAGALTLLYYIGTFIAGTDAMGQGDVKLAGFIGLFLGSKGVLTALFLSTILGACSGVLVLTLGWGVREDGFTKFAFGPYICAGSLVTFFYGADTIINLYATLNEHIIIYVSTMIM